MEQNREPGNKAIYIYIVNESRTKEPGTYNGEG